MKSDFTRRLARTLTFYSLWILANGLGMLVAYFGGLLAPVAVALFLSLPLIMFKESWSSSTYTKVGMIWLLIAVTVGGTAFGLIIGAAQDVVLSKYMSKWAVWFPKVGIAGTISASLYAIIYLLSSVGSVSFDPQISNIIFLGLSGAVVVVLQWVTLNRLVHRASFWLLPGTVGFAVYSLIVYQVYQPFVDLVEPPLVQIAMLQALAIGGVVYGIVTGPSLFWLATFKKD